MIEPPDRFNCKSYDEYVRKIKAMKRESPKAKGTPPEFWLMLAILVAVAIGFRLAMYY